MTYYDKLAITAALIFGISLVINSIFSAYKERYGISDEADKVWNFIVGLMLLSLVYLVIYGIGYWLTWMFN